MPSVLIEIRRQYTQEQEVALMEAVHRALREAFKILPGDKNVRLVVHEPHRFCCPPDREKSEYYTHISIDAFAGRSLDAKRNLYKAIVNNLEPLGIPKEALINSSMSRVAGQIGKIATRTAQVVAGTLTPSRTDTRAPDLAATHMGRGLAGELPCCVSCQGE